MSAPAAGPGDARARAAARTAQRYRLLAQAFGPPSSELSRVTELAARTAGPSVLPPGVPADLELEHARLFVGPGRVPAPPCGSVYLDGGVLMGESTADALRHYREAGFVLAPDARTLPDHLIVELSFLELLAEEAARAWRRGDAATARRWLGRRGAFLCDHLGAWAPRLAERVLAASTEPFYRTAAVHLRELVAADLEALLAAVGAGAPGASAGA